jgi:hypothetical protein
VRHADWTARAHVHRNLQVRTTPAAAMTFTTFELVSRWMRENLPR